MADNTLKTLVSTENTQEAIEVMSFLNELVPEERKDFLTFVQGIRFARGAMGVIDERLSSQNV